MLKLDVAFLYDLLGASQEHRIKPKKFAQTDIDEVILGHTNRAEYKKLLNNEFMQDAQDHTIKIDIPYITEAHRRDPDLREGLPARGKIRGKHIAPHTLEVAAMWAVLTRLEDPKKHNLSLLQKLKLYDGKALPGYTQDTVEGSAKESKREGMEGISPRYIQDKISERPRGRFGRRDHQPLHGVERARKRAPSPLAHHQRRAAEEVRRGRRHGEARVRKIVKNEVQRAISADEDAIGKLADNYIDNIKAFTLKERVKNATPARTSRTSA